MARLDEKKWTAVEVASVVGFCPELVFLNPSLRNIGGLLILVDIYNFRNILPIRIDDFTARAIALKMTGEKPLRPMTHDLLFSTIQKVGGEIKAIFITDCREDIYYAQIILEKKGERITIDARPSDAVALAVRAELPIFVAKHLMQRIKEIIEEDLESEPEEQKPSESERIDFSELLKKMREARQRKDYQTAAHLKDEIVKQLAKKIKIVQPESSKSELETEIERLTNIMREAVENEDYERAAELRDKINFLKKEK